MTPEVTAGARAASIPRLDLTDGLASYLLESVLERGMPRRKGRFKKSSGEGIDFDADRSVP